MAEALSPKEYELEVLKVAVQYARVRKLEKGGNLHTGWFDARSDYLKAVKAACEKFPGMDFDIVDDAAQLVINKSKKARNAKQERSA